MHPNRSSSSIWAWMVIWFCKGQIGCQVWILVLSRNENKAYSSMVWNPFLCPSWSIFGWKLIHRNFPISLWAQLIGIPLASCYPLCLNESESNNHLSFNAAMLEVYGDGLSPLLAAPTPSPFPSHLYGPHCPGLVTCDQLERLWVQSVADPEFSLEWDRNWRL